MVGAIAGCPFAKFSRLGRFSLKLTAAPILRGATIVDLYTKIVLTVIAVALSVIAAQNLRPTPVHAQTPPVTRVVICDPHNSERCVGVADKGWLDVLPHQSN